MPRAENSPTLRRWELSSVLREHRSRLHMNGEDVARAIQEAFAGSFSPAKLSRIENGQQAPSTRDVSDLAHVYGLSATERERLIQLAKDAKKPGWWQQYQAIQTNYQTYTDLESAAVLVRNYESTFVPGLLQTPEYAKAVIDGLNPDYEDSHRAELLAVRLRRQERVTGPDPLTLHAIIQENALRRTIGEPGTMLAQIEHLQRMAERPNVTLQVVRYNAGLYAGLQAAAFCMLDFPDPAVMSTVFYLELVTWNLFVEESEQRSRLEAAFEEMHEKIAVPVAKTQDFLADLHSRVPRDHERG